MVTVIGALKVPVTFCPFCSKPMPIASVGSAPAGRPVKLDVVPLVTTTCTGEARAPAGTFTVTELEPTVALTVPPEGWIVWVVAMVVNPFGVVGPLAAGSAPPDPLPPVYPLPAPQAGLESTSPLRAITADTEIKRAALLGSCPTEAPFCRWF